MVICPYWYFTGSLAIQLLHVNTTMSSDESENENVQLGVRGYQFEPEFTDEELEVFVYLFFFFF